MQTQVQDISQLGTVLAFIIAAIGFMAVSLTIAKLLRRQNPNHIKLTTYESGEQAVGNAWTSFNIRFYVVGLLFLLFDVELAFLFPWAVIFKDPSMMEATGGMWSHYLFYEALVFIGILALGLAFAWVHGFLDWERPKAKIVTSPSPVPMVDYQEFNKRETQIITHKQQ